MIYEIVGSRVIAPYIGTSTYTWTSLIGIILAALSLGYWLGGRWADRNPRVSVLASAIFFAAGLISLTVLIKEPVLSVISGRGLPVEVSSLIAATLLFAPASVFLGFVPPYAVRLSVTSIETSGVTVGRLYALSTIGSIAGTFSAGFFLIPFLGTGRTLYLLAGVLFLLSALLAPFSVRPSRIALIVVFFLGVALTEGSRFMIGSMSNYHDIDTQYSRVRVFDTTKNGRPLRAMAIDPYIYQTSMYLDTGESGARYLQYYGLAELFRGVPDRSLMIGGAGYGYPKKYLGDYPNASIDVVEIDPGMTRIAKLHFGLKENTRLRTIHMDGRAFLNQSGSAVYDAVYLDAFTSLFSIPFQLTTVEAVIEIKRALKPDGIVLVNLGTSIKGKGSLFLNAQVATYKKVFPYVKIFQTDPAKPPEKVQNVVLVACSKPLKRTVRDSSYDLLLDNEIVEPRISAEVLTDDFAPVERMISYAQSQYSKAGND